MLIRGRRRLYEIAYFWGLVGTFNAILTPELEVGYPAYRFFQYFSATAALSSVFYSPRWG